MSRYVKADMIGCPCGYCEGYYECQKEVDSAPSIDIVRCGECIYYDTPHVENDGKRIEYEDMPKEAFDLLGTGLVTMAYGINVGGRCTVDYNTGYAEDKRVFRSENDFCSRGERKGE